jgi:hypothetical protein
MNYGFSDCKSPVAAKVPIDDLWTPRWRASQLSVPHQRDRLPACDLQPRNEVTLTSRGSEISGVLHNSEAPRRRSLCEQTN